MSGKWIPIGAGRWRLVDTSATAVASRSDAPAILSDHLSLKERRGLKMQLGRDFDSRSRLNAYMKDHDMRFVEKNDRQDRGYRRMKEWIRDTKPGDRGRPPFHAKDKA